MGTHDAPLTGPRLNGPNHLLSYLASGLHFLLSVKSSLTRAGKSTGFCSFGLPHDEGTWTHSWALLLHSSGGTM